MNKFCGKKKKRQNLFCSCNAQSMIEFTFSLVVFAFMIYAAAKFAFWLAPDLVERGRAYDAEMSNVDIDYTVPLTSFEGVVYGD